MVNVTRQLEIVPAQDKLSNANIAIVGCGAIGSVVANILARMGAAENGKLLLVDGDDIEDHNLNRQLFDVAHVGRNKAKAVKVILGRLSKGRKIETIERYIEPDELALEEYDIVVMAADSLYFQGFVWKNLAAIEPDKRPAFFSARMSGYDIELFSYWPNGPDPSDTIYFADKQDKDYGKGATCTGEVVEEVKVPAISTTTNLVSSLTAQGIVHFVNGWDFSPHIRINLVGAVGGDVEISDEEE